MQHLKDDSEAPCMNISDEFGLWHASARRFPVVANKGSAVSLRKVRKSSTVWQAKYTKKQIREGGRQGKDGQKVYNDFGGIEAELEKEAGPARTALTRNTRTGRCNERLTRTGRSIWAPICYQTLLRLMHGG